MLEYSVFLWLFFFILSLVAEALTMSLVAIWLMPGALIGIVLSLCHVEMRISVLVFVIVSTILLLSTRRISRRILQNKPTATNADRVIGQEGVITEEVNRQDGKGQVKVLGQVWSCYPAEENRIIPADTEVRILRCEGVHLIVTNKIS